MKKDIIDASDPDEFVGVRIAELTSTAYEASDGWVEAEVWALQVAQALLHALMQQQIAIILNVSSIFRSNHAQQPKLTLVRDPEYAMALMRRSGYPPSVVALMGQTLDALALAGESPAGPGPFFAVDIEDLPMSIADLDRRGLKTRLDETSLPVSFCWAPAGIDSDATLRSVRAAARDEGGSEAHSGIVRSSHVDRYTGSTVRRLRRTSPASQECGASVRLIKFTDSTPQAASNHLQLAVHELIGAVIDRDPR